MDAVVVGPRRRCCRNPSRGRHHARRPRSLTCEICSIPIGFAGWPGDRRRGPALEQLARLSRPPLPIPFTARSPLFCADARRKVTCITMTGTRGSDVMADKSQGSNGAGAAPAVDDPAAVRNVVLLGPSGGGKPTLVDALLAPAGVLSS